MSYSVSLASFTYAPFADLYTTLSFRWYSLCTLSDSFKLTCTLTHPLSCSPLIFLPRVQIEKRPAFSTLIGGVRTLTSKTADALTASASAKSLASSSTSVGSHSPASSVDSLELLDPKSCYPPNIVLVASPGVPNTSENILFSEAGLFHTDTNTHAHKAPRELDELAVTIEALVIIFL